jgi:hypothetical protein
MRAWLCSTTGAFFQPWTVSATSSGCWEATNEKNRRLKAEDLADERFVRKLDKEGKF